MKYYLTENLWNCSETLHTSHSLPKFYASVLTKEFVLVLMVNPFTSVWITAPLALSVIFHYQISTYFCFIVLLLLSIIPIKRAFKFFSGKHSSLKLLSPSLLPSFPSHFPRSSLYHSITTPASPTQSLFPSPQ